MRKDRNTEEDPTCAAMINEGRRRGKRERERNLVTIFLARAIIYEAYIEADDNKTENGFAREFARIKQ